MTKPPLTPAQALRVILDQVDYTKNACSLTEMVGAVLSTQVIELCHAALSGDEARDKTTEKVT